MLRVIGAPVRRSGHTERLMGKVAIHVKVPKKTRQPTARRAVRGPGPRSLALIPAKNRATAKS